ncbi:DUF2218 domain-containing protein [Nocardia asiatica]
MPTIEARISTDRPSRYLRQFCKHAAAMGALRARGQQPPRARHGHPDATPEAGPNGPDGMRIHSDWSDTSGTVSFDPVGRCVLHAEENALLVRIEAIDARVLQRIRDIVTRDFERFGRNQLTVEWHPLGGGDAGAARLAR